MSKPVCVRFPPHLRRFVDVPAQVVVSGSTVRELLDAIELDFPGVVDYLVHENGELRQHVNIFLNNRIISDRSKLSDSVSQIDEVFIMQALSGG